MITNFDFISLNGMEMRHPFEAYVRLWEELKWQQDDDKKKICSPEAAAAKLEALFTNKGVAANNKGKGRVAVVLVDEIDYLVTKKQTVLYNLFDWPNRALQCGSKNRLVVIGVSNTLNLPERLHPRVQSRIGSRRCYFKSYNFKQTVAILKAKMTQASPSYTVFDDDAIIFASRKTAALSGDLRKAFHICRAAAEMVMEEAEKDQQLQKNPIVRIKDVLKVSRESFNSAQSKAVSLCTSFEALLLVSLAALSKSTGRESGGFDVEELLSKMEGTANAFGDMEYLPAPSLPETLGMLTRLGEAHLVSLQTPRTSSVSYRAALAGSGGAWPLVSLQVDDIAIMLALRQSPHNELAQKYLVTNSC
jgi:origin recognition complex subunit 1